MREPGASVDEEAGHPFLRHAGIFAAYKWRLNRLRRRQGSLICFPPQQICGVKIPLPGVHAKPPISPIRMSLPHLDLGVKFYICEINRKALHANKRTAFS